MQMNGESLDFTEISLDGFQVVSVDLFTHPTRQNDPACTLWSNSICFNKAALTALNNCDRVRIEINPQKRCILIVPVTAKDKDSIRWSKNIKDPVPRKIECKVFSSQLFKMWEWDPEYVFRAIGRLVISEKKVMLLFDFKEPESWKYRARMKDAEE